jgi:glucose-1-phosphatase
LAIRALIFDLGKVIVDFSYAEAYRRMQSLSGLNPDELRARLFAGPLAVDFECGRVDSQSFIAEVNHRMETRISPADFGHLWSSIFHATPLLPESLLQNLRSRHRLVLLSNTNPLHFGMIRETYPHIVHFDALVLSYELGVMKPDPAIYRAALDQAHCAPDECLFFDDMPGNVAGARALGLHARQFSGYDQLLLDLAEFGISAE